jgi:adenine phosphoribosyltransferase
MTLQEVRSLIVDVPDFPSKGILFRDITPLLADADGFQGALRLLSESISDLQPTQFVGIESRGFIFASALAQMRKTGLTLVRKKGKLPRESVRELYELEYGSDEIEIHADALQRGQKVVIVDDVLATGGTALSAIRLCQKLRADVLGFLVLIELEALQGRSRLKEIPLFSLLKL